MSCVIKCRDAVRYATATRRAGIVIARVMIGASMAMKD